MFLDVSCTDPEGLGAILNLVHSAYGIIQIGVPIILLVIGTVDLGKAVMAGDEKEIKAATGMLMKRAGAAVAVFLLIYIVNLVTGLVGEASGGLKWKACWPGLNGGVKKEEDGKGKNDDDEGDNGYINTDMYLL